MVRVHVITTRDEFLAACAELAAGSGPIAIDAERASGFTYSQRAFLIQVHRRESGSYLFDPPALGRMDELFTSMADEEWVLHAASQDLACLREVGITPAKIFDTELSARLLGLERVGLGPVIESLLGIHLAKEHSAQDWSTRPLPEPWLTYATHDVEYLVDLRDVIAQMLDEAGKTEWAVQEFQATLDKPDKPPMAEPWRKLSGLHTLRAPRQLAIARALWTARDNIAREKDVSPGRLVPDSSLVAAARTPLSSQADLAKLREFTGRASRSLINQWWQAWVSGNTDADLPQVRVPSDALPPPRAWADRNPAAHERLSAAREGLAEVAETHKVPVENLLTPSILREVAWHATDDVSPGAIDAALLAQGARTWQRELTVPVISSAFVEANQKVAELSQNVS